MTSRGAVESSLREAVVGLLRVVLSHPPRTEFGHTRTVTANLQFATELRSTELR